MDRMDRVKDLNTQRPTSDARRLTPDARHLTPDARRLTPTLFCVLCILCGSFSVALASPSDLDEFKIKREPVFDVAQKPTITRRGDLVEITFETKGFCDVTVAIEESGTHNPPPTTYHPRIVRHLASGVLGPKAPAPFLKDSKRQTLLWDGKDDAGRYLDNQDDLAVRVSLGLRARFERTLFWSPYKRSAKEPPLVCPTPEGVYVLDGRGADQIRLFNHAGEYERTIYPFPAAKLGQIEGLTWHVAPQDGRRLPLRAGHYQDTFFTSGINASERMDRRDHGLFGNAATAMAVRNGRLALAYFTLNRFSTDWTTGGVPLSGPSVCLPLTYGGGSNWRLVVDDVTPKSVAFSPDGKWLYLAGYTWDKYRLDGWYENWACLNGVLRMRPDGDRPPQLFVGSLDEKEFGTDERGFRCAASVAVDAQGRVYVADYMNDRVQVYSPDAVFLKTIKVDKPVQVSVHQRNGDIYVFSWMLTNQFMGLSDVPIPAQMTHIGPLENPRVIGTFPLEIDGYVASRHGGGKGYGSGHYYRTAVDSWSDPPTVWLVPGMPTVTTVPGAKYGSPGRTPWQRCGIRLLVEKDGALVVRRDFAREAEKDIVHLAHPAFFRQRLYVNPRTGKLYLAEDLGFSKSFKSLVEIDPDTGKVAVVDLPFDAEDLAFDLNGLAYLRTRTIVGRYDPQTWREVPWDYGIEQPSVGTSSSGDGKRAPMASGIPIPSATLWHHGGMGVSPTGHLAVACTASGPDFSFRAGPEERVDDGKPYNPVLSPGRVIWKKGAIVNVFDEHGRLIIEDAIPGLSNCNGLFIDRDDGLYVLNAQRRILDGTPYFNSKTGTLMKFRPRAGRVLSASDHAQVPLPVGEYPQRPPDLVDAAAGRAWAVDVEWMYGGVGFDPTKDNVCACSNSRFALDHFARSFAPEVDHFSVAVLDASGNLILRVGQYGNVEDGGDEVALVYAPYVATDTDRRLFIADPGNARIAGVRLDYHATHRIPLRTIPEAK
jgi:hypothetical protein